MFNKNTTLLLLGLLFILIFLSVIIFNASQGNKKIEVSPSPIPSASPILEETLQRQAEADVNVANIQENIFRKYPWYLKLPLQEKNYFVYFDASKGSFFASIYPQKSSSIPIDDQVKSYQEEILGRLTQIGVDVNTYQIIWDTKIE